MPATLPQDVPASGNRPRRPRHAFTVVPRLVHRPILGRAIPGVAAPKVPSPLTRGPAPTAPGPRIGGEHEAVPDPGVDRGCGGLRRHHRRGPGPLPRGPGDGREDPGGGTPPLPVAGHPVLPDRRDRGPAHQLGGDGPGPALGARGDGRDRAREHGPRALHELRGELGQRVLLAAHAGAGVPDARRLPHRPHAGDRRP